MHTHTYIYEHYIISCAMPQLKGHKVTQDIFLSASPPTSQLPVAEESAMADLLALHINQLLSLDTTSQKAAREHPGSLWTSTRHMSSTQHSFRLLLSEGGDDAVRNPHRAQISQFELFELVLLLRLDKQFPVEQFEATVSQSTVPSPLLY